MLGSLKRPEPAVTGRQLRLQPTLIQRLQHALDDLQVVAVRSTFMQQHDGTRAQVRQQPCQHAVRRAADPVEAARAPAHPDQPQSLQHRRHERIGHAHHRAVPAHRLATQRLQCVLAALDLGAHCGRAQPPEARLRVAVAVIAEVVATSQDLGHQFRLRQRSFPHQEEGCTCLVAVQQVKHGTGFRARTVINGEPDRVASIRNPAQHRRIEAAVGQEHRHHEQRMAGHHQRQAPIPTGQPPYQDHDQLRRHQPRQPAPGAGRDAMQCSCVAHPP